MAEARLNFVDHPDSTFSCNAVFLPPAVIGSSYNPHSQSHQMVRILKQFIDVMHHAAPEDRFDDDAIAANRPTRDTEAYMHLTDMGEAFRLHRVYLPAKPGYVDSSPAHRACAIAHWALNYLNRAKSDAIVTRAGEDVGIVAKELINALNGH